MTKHVRIWEEGAAFGFLFCLKELKVAREEPKLRINADNGSKVYKSYLKSSNFKKTTLSDLKLIPFWARDPPTCHLCRVNPRTCVYLPYFWSTYSWFLSLKAYGCTYVTCEESEVSNKNMGATVCTQFRLIYYLCYAPCTMCELMIQEFSFTG